ncbi:glycosyltransferase [Nocardioides campestrisoli]|uniref:glycosyltransferase n=1 Tax=Nocardioides campestrisoli TaxID=2736757 RepID=UPI0015E7C177|nr:glycosyltransferase family 2 protein [Nocardioides campestrisoli]
MPRQPVVRHNDYRSLTPPALGEWDPRLSVSMVVPAYNYHRTLPYVLAGLAGQSYPAHLLEVVVVDDQSTPPLELPEVRPENTRILRVESGWGRANACHLGAQASDGDVLHWYDADMLPYREEVEAHMRWHHLVDYAVPGGDKRFVDPDWLFGLDPAEVRDRVAAGEAGDFFPGVPHEEHKWVEGYWRRTDDLTLAGPRAQRVHIGMTGSVTRDLYRASRGFDPQLRLGEDMALGHELAQVGGVFVVEREARSWHLGRSQVLRRAEQVNRYNDPYLANLVPAMRPKRRKHGRSYEVPYVEVVVPVADRLTDSEVAQGADEVVACVDALLDADFSDLRVLLVGPWGRVHEERIQPVEDPALELRIVHRSYRGEPRVSLVESAPGHCPESTDAEFRLTLPDTSHAPLPQALQRLLDDLERTHHGRRTITYPDGAEARLERIAALARVERVAQVGDDRDELMEEAFGTGSYAAKEVGFVPTEERDLPRFVLKPKPAMSPEKSRALLLGTPASETPVSDAPVAEPVSGEESGRRFRWRRPGH